MSITDPTKTAAAPSGGEATTKETDAYLSTRTLKTGTAGWVLLAGLGVS